MRLFSKLSLKRGKQAQNAEEDDKTSSDCRQEKSPHFENTTEENASSKTLFESDTESTSDSYFEKPTLRRSRKFYHLSSDAATNIRYSWEHIEDVLDPTSIKSKGIGIFRSIAEVFEIESRGSDYESYDADVEDDSTEDETQQISDRSKTLTPETEHSDELIEDYYSETTRILDSVSATLGDMKEEDHAVAPQHDALSALSLQRTPEYLLQNSRPVSTLFRNHFTFEKPSS